MHRYLVERTYPPSSAGLAAAADDAARAALLDAPPHRAHAVRWLRSYLTPDLGRSYCVVEAASAEAVRRAAQDAGLPVDRICEVRMIELGAATPGTQEAA